MYTQTPQSVSQAVHHSMVAAMGTIMSAGNSPALHEGLSCPKLPPQGDWEPERKAGKSTPSWHDDGLRLQCGRGVLRKQQTLLGHSASGY